MNERGDSRIPHGSLGKSGKCSGTFFCSLDENVNSVTLFCCAWGHRTLTVSHLQLMLDTCRVRSALFCSVLYFITPGQSVDIMLRVVVIILTVFWVSTLSSCLSCFVCIAVVISISKFCIVTATCWLSSGKHYFPAIGGIAYIPSFSCCETRESIWVSHLSPYLHPMYVDFPILSHPCMSMTSTVTAWVVHDLTLGDAHD